MSWLRYSLGIIALLAVAIYFGLPPTLKAMGFHPHHEIPEFDLAGHRALIVTTSHDTLGETGRATGVFGSEMTVPYYVFLEAGLDVDIASIKGGEIPVEPWSMSWPLATPEDLRFKKDPAAMAMLRDSLPITEVDPSAYDVIFLAGGWGAAYDLAQSDELAQVITKANAQGAVLGSVCHGALGLVNAQNTEGSPLIEGRRVTGVTDKQIKELGIEITPLHPESEMRSMNAVFEAETAWRDFFATHTVVDGNLVTGQNQNSGYETAHRILELLAER
ncbi:type 1 glutamine amidotransferase domain-containing protein [Pseudovibrio exalbescens]|uniref:type 1 glutamine amidotransferase domain-containing protein n=1 Tax=Pseudovibrio exalbescens TaxID=197461 RepID=UPI0023652D5A|nr:type 1 glutamine amidotransferase domain-containing protein [Pseudovibrio exalbescens]MDD7909999.1 type 1 glutamine amidotransferase domain-containing protein [Pseudovibrio exalbescens]